MRKWMRERMKRRKKTDKPEGEAAQAPLQPAYFEAQPAEAQPPAERSQPEAEEPEAAAEPEPGETSQAAAGEAPRRKRRRRGRGGRGRGAGKGVPSAQADEPTAESEPPAVEAAPAAVREPVAKPTGPAPASSAARPSRGVVVLAIGLPGSGKSSWFKRHNIAPLSSDVLRALLFDDPQEQRFQDLVFSNLRSMLKARLIARRPLNYVDATNLSSHERHGWIKLAKDYSYEVQAVYFDVPVEVCLERNQKRQRQVPEDAMRRMASKLRAPTFEEGFSKITVVKVKKKEGA